MTQQPNPQPEREEMIEVAEDAMMRIVIGIQAGKILPHDVHKEAVALAGFVFAHFVSMDTVREAIKTIEATNDSNGRYNACQELRRALGLDKPERTE